MCKISVCDKFLLNPLKRVHMGLKKFEDEFSSETRKEFIAF